MARLSPCLSLSSLLFIPASFALFTSFLILFYISSTSHVFFNIHPNPILIPLLHHNFSKSATVDSFDSAKETPDGSASQNNSTHPHTASNSKGKKVYDVINKKGMEDVFHDRDIFLEDYKQMKRRFKIYVYPPHSPTRPFANAFLPVDFEPEGNYASESYFKKALMNNTTTTHNFITKDPTKADLFFLPFSVARLRHDPGIGVNGIKDFIRDYIFNISQNYPYWNRTGGSDHFYAACHSIGRSVMEKTHTVKLNAIQIVCSSSYFLSRHLPHKDASLPQIWPRKGGDPPNLASSKTKTRKKLAFFAGSDNSPVRKQLLKSWRNDSEIFAYSDRLNTPYDVELLGSKFCLHVKGFEVNTARIADSLYYGCVPVIIANHYDLPFTDILNWKSFAIIVATVDIPKLKEILKRVNSNEFQLLQSNVLKVRKHFQWHDPPIDLDAFYMVMYELWLRRSYVRLSNL